MIKKLNENTLIRFGAAIPGSPGAAIPTIHTQPEWPKP